MRAAILTIGTEILFGQIVNTNAAYLSTELQNLGVDVLYHYTVGDNPKRLKELLEIAYRDVDLILTTGGLGPTQDDLTKQVICEYFGETMELHPEIEKWLRGLFESRNFKWTDNNLTQCYFPTNCEIIPNPVGTAPGFKLCKDGKVIMTMPGVPREMKRMFQDTVKPYLQANADGYLYYEIVKTMGIGESHLETVLLPLIDGQTDPTLATYCKDSECAVRITSKRKTLEEAKKAVYDMKAEVMKIIGDHVFSSDNEDLVSVLGKTLIEKNITISACESCTAGMFAAALGGIPGISKVFDSGLVTYSWASKQRELGVRHETLEKYSAESKEVAAEMVEGLYNKTGSDVCVSITGIAGPDDISDEKHAGLAYIGLKYKDKTEVVVYDFKNRDRETNRTRMTLRMISEVYNLVK